MYACLLASVTTSRRWASRNLHRSMHIYIYIYICMYVFICMWRTHTYTYMHVLWQVCGWVDWNTASFWASCDLYRSWRLSRSSSCRQVSRNKWSKLKKLRNSRASKLCKTFVYQTSMCVCVWCMHMRWRVSRSTCCGSVSVYMYFCVRVCIYVCICACLCVCVCAYMRLSRRGSK
jgi:hypothetical protein